MRHAINEDVPGNRRGLVTRGYWAWIFAAAGFCADWLTITLMWDPPGYTAHSRSPPAHDHALLLLAASCFICELHC